MASEASTTKPRKREHLFKVLVIGELATGKTALVKRYVHNFFSDNYRATIGVDFALKLVQYDDDTLIRVQLWDIAGQERFGNMTRVYYKDAVGCFIVFDVSRTATFDAVTRWKLDLDSKVQLPDGSPVPCVLLANKCDLVADNAAMSHGEMDKFCRDHGFLGWFETSAKESINIDTSCRFLIDAIMKYTEGQQSAEPSSSVVDSNGLRVADANPKPNKSSGCCGKD